MRQGHAASMKRVALFIASALCNAGHTHFGSETFAPKKHGGKLLRIARESEMAGFIQKIQY
jgi:hypothetical protein